MPLNTPPFYKISIHALREEGDIGQTKICLPWSAISIHALREEGDRIASPHLETHSDFYPRPPRGGRQQRLQSMIDLPEISIHALREEGDRSRAGDRDSHPNFYPRPPRGGRR